jgi:hypothetical protein
MKNICTENNSFYYIQNIIDAVMREAFRVRMTSHELKEHQSKNNNGLQGNTRSTFL